jgi:hypothetical protein
MAPQKAAALLGSAASEAEDKRTAVPGELLQTGVIMGSRAHGTDTNPDDSLLNAAATRGDYQPRDSEEQTDDVEKANPREKGIRR